MDGCKINAIEQGAADTGKPNSTELLIYWEYQSFANYADMKGISQGFSDLIFTDLLGDCRKTLNLWFWLL